MVPCDEEEHYDDYVMTLYAQGYVLTPNEWLDWGLSRSPPKSTLAPACGSYTRAFRQAAQSGAENAAAGSLPWEYPNPRLLAKDK